MLSTFMNKFDSHDHSRLIGHVLIAMGGFAWLIALAGFIPDRIFTLPNHFFGNEGAMAVGSLLVVSGFLMRK